MLQWAKSDPGNKGQLVHNIMYLDIPIRKSRVNTVLKSSACFVVRKSLMFGY